MRRSIRRSRSPSRGSFFDRVRGGSVSEETDAEPEGVLSSDVRLLVKGKLKNRHLSLFEEYLCIDKRAPVNRSSDSGSRVVVPCDQVLKAEAAHVAGVKAAGHAFSVQLLGQPPFLFCAADEATQKDWILRLSSCKINLELKPWRIDPSTVELGECVGSGASGKVWQGTINRTPVAVKEMHVSADCDMVKQEILVLSKLRNPYCVRLLGIYEKEKKLYIVTELVQGGSLDAHLYEKKSPMSFEAKLMILRDISRGLAYLHSNNILHRDIKSDNCLILSLDPNAQQLASLADFGISKNALEAEEDGRQTIAQGTPLYMAPEVFTDEYSAAVDVWSFGMLMCEILTETRPWAHLKKSRKGLSGAILAAVEADERPPLPDSALGGAGDRLSGLVDRCWKAEASERPDITVVADELTTLVHEARARAQTVQSRLAQLALTEPDRPAPAPPSISHSSGAYENDAGVALPCAYEAAGTSVKHLLTILRDATATEEPTPLMVTELLVASFSCEEREAAAISEILSMLNKQPGPIKKDTVELFAAYFDRPGNGSDCDLQEVVGLLLKPFFFGCISGGSSEVLLQADGREGAFLVRLSSSSPGHFALSVFSSGRVRHWKIPILRGLRVIVKGRVFSSMYEFLDEFKRNSLAEDSDIRLLEHCRR